MLLGYGMQGHDDSLDLRPTKNHESVVFCFMMELCFGIIYQTVLLHIRTVPTSPSENLALRSVAIAIISYGAYQMTFNLSGGPLNPAIGFAGSTFRAMISKDSDPEHFKYLTAYFLGPLLSAPFAAIFTMYVGIPLSPKPAAPALAESPSMNLSRDTSTGNLSPRMTPYRVNESTSTIGNHSSMRNTTNSQNLK